MIGKFLLLPHSWIYYFAKVLDINEYAFSWVDNFNSDETNTDLIWIIRSKSEYSDFLYNLSTLDQNFHFDSFLGCFYFLCCLLSLIFYMRIGCLWVWL